MLVTFGLVFERIFLTIKCTFEPSSQFKFPILKAAGLLLWQPIIRARKTTAKRSGLLRRLTDGMSCLLSSLSVVLQRTQFLCYHLLFVIPCPCQVMAFHCWPPCLHLWSPNWRRYVRSFPLNRHMMKLVRPGAACIPLPYRAAETLQLLQTVVDTYTVQIVRHFGGY